MSQFPTYEELLHLPLSRLQHLDISNAEEEALVQKVVNLRSLTGSVPHPTHIRVPDIMNGEDEAKWQGILDKERERMRPKQISVQDEDTPLGLVERDPVVEELPAVVDQQMLDENPELKEAGIEVGTPIEQTDTNVETKAKECCGSLGYRHKKDCPTLAK